MSRFGFVIPPAGTLYCSSSKLMALPLPSNVNCPPLSGMARASTSPSMTFPVAGSIVSQSFVLK